MDDDDGFISFNDAAEIGFKVVEMADRVKVGNACLPGTKATWRFEIDGVRYLVAATVDARPAPADPAPEAEDPAR